MPKEIAVFLPRGSSDKVCNAGSSMADYNRCVGRGVVVQPFRPV